MSKLPRYNTAYSEYVFSNLPKLLAAGEGTYDMNALADGVGLKPTQHFKKRVKQLCVEGLLRADTVFTPHGGLKIVYSLQQNNPVKDNPF